MDTRNHIRTHDDMNRAFEDGSAFTATPEQYERYLRTLCSAPIKNEEIRHVEILRGLTINHIQMARTITKLESTITILNTENGKVSRRVLVLTVVTIVLGALQCLLAAIALCHP